MSGLGGTLEKKDTEMKAGIRRFIDCWWQSHGPVYFLHQAYTEGAIPSLQGSVGKQFPPSKVKFSKWKLSTGLHSVAQVSGASVALAVPLSSNGSVGMERSRSCSPRHEGLQLASLQLASLQPCGPWLLTVCSPQNYQCFISIISCNFYYKLYTWTI